VANHQIPPIIQGDGGSVLKDATTILYYAQGITFEMPFWMPTAAFDKVATESVVTQLSELIGDGLAFLASNKYIHVHCVLLCIKDMKFLDGTQVLRGFEFLLFYKALDQFGGDLFGVLVAKVIFVFITCDMLKPLEAKPCERLLQRPMLNAHQLIELIVVT
jgi:hypothetical protein